MIDNNDYILRAVAAEGRIRAFAATTRTVTETAREAHRLSPIASAALGRTMTAALMMGAMLKNEDDLLTLSIKGDGPILGITVTADSKGNVKGFVGDPSVLLPPNSKGKLDVGGAVGRGILSVIKDLGLKDPYVGQVALQSGEIADDLTYYFAVSEQTPSAVSLGVLMNKNNTVRQSGGFIIQLMPDIDDETVKKLEERLSRVESVTTMLDKGLSPEDMIELLLSDLDPEILDKSPVCFKCDCSKKRVEKALISVGRDELSAMINDGKDIEVKCDFCEKAYKFSVDDLKRMADNV
ncbi:MAG: Hsp33 family molecular chaperone HslO [Lachnospiraceae bacterium]|nr:Hsp33 family molecular chaperone HslO [Lachnospiraceae bacterium]